MKKMKQKTMRKIGIASALGLVVLVMLGLYGASNYMLNYSLNYPKEERMTAEHWKNRMKNECCKPSVRSSGERMCPMYAVP